MFNIERTNHNAGDVSGLESGDGELEGLEHAVVDPLTDETILVSMFFNLFFFATDTGEKISLSGVFVYGKLSSTLV